MKKKPLLLYNVRLRPEVHSKRKLLPGHIKHRIKKLIEGLSQNPFPPKSKILILPEKSDVLDWEIYRLRIENWRVIYGVHKKAKEVAILSIQKRPPYNYEDLESLLLSLPF